MKKILGFFLLGVLLLPANSAHAAWFGQKEKKAAPQPVAEVRKKTPSASPVSAMKAAPPAMVKKESSPPKKMASVEKKNANNGRFFDLESDGTVQVNTKEKETRLNSEETEKVKEEMLKLKQNVDAVRGVQALPQLPPSGLSSLKPPVIPPRLNYSSPAGGAQSASAAASIPTKPIKK